MQDLLGLAILLLVALVMIVLVLVLMLVHGSTHPPRHTAGYAVARNLPCDPEDLKLPFEAWTLDLPDGAKLPVWEILFDKASRDKGDKCDKCEKGDLTVVFVHGWGRSRIDMLTSLEPWKDICNRLVFYELRGHGDSENCNSRLGCDEHKDLIALLERLGETKFLLVGRSMGAGIAIAAAASESKVSDSIVGVIAYAPYIDFNKTLRGRLLSMGYPARPISDLAIVCFTLQGLKQNSTLKDAGLLRCPLLVIHGSEDKITSAREVKMLVDASKYGQLYTSQGAGHSNAHLVDAEAHDGVVCEFVNQNLARS